MPSVRRCSDDTSGGSISRVQIRQVNRRLFGFGQSRRTLGRKLPSNTRPRPRFLKGKTYSCKILWKPSLERVQTAVSYGTSCRFASTRMVKSSAVGTVSTGMPRCFALATRSSANIQDALLQIVAQNCLHWRLGGCMELGRSDVTFILLLDLR